MSKLTERQEELRETMRRLKFPENNFKHSEHRRQYIQKMIGGSPSEMEHEFAFAPHPTDGM